MIDHGSGYAAKSHQIDLWDQANNSLIHVVTETVYRGNKNHLTEKTFKPIVMQQPFIIQSCKGSLEYHVDMDLKRLQIFGTNPMTKQTMVYAHMK